MTNLTKSSASDAAFIVQPWPADSLGSGSRLALGNDLRALSKAEGLTALGAHIAAGARAQVVFLREGRVRAGLVSPLFFQRDRAFALHVKVVG